MQNNVRRPRRAWSLLVALCFSITPSLADSATTEPTTMTHEQMISHLREANDVVKEWKSFGHHPFGAVLVAPDNQRVLMTQGNISVVRHAETELSRRAAETYPADYLAKCTLVTTFEPCVLCAGNIYFANIGKVVYGATEETLKELTGTSKVNPTMHLPCKQVFAAGQKSIQLNAKFAIYEPRVLKKRPSLDAYVPGRDWQSCKA